MATLRPDPTFYPSPKMAMQAPQEELAYTVVLNPNGNGRPDALAVLDVNSNSSTYNRVVGRVELGAGDEVHHFGWNACSASLCPYAPHPHIEHRYLIVPGLKSSRIHVIDTKPDPTQPKREILRIISEALTNARRHSEATNVLVRVGISHGTLFGEVEDDGRGFDPTQKESTTATTGGGVGMRSMRERANHLGGELKTEGEPQQGTKVRFELVLQRELEEADQEEVHILLVDDHATIRDALASSFEGEEGLEVVGQAGSMAEARGILAHESVDMAIIDLGLPDGYGADLIKELRERNPRAQALVLSATLDRAQIARAVERGAAGVLNKTTHLLEVAEAVKRLRAGETLMPLEEVVGLLRYAGSEREQEYEARQAIEKLTPREREVLQALAEGLDSEGIAEKLHIALRTERNHMSSILSKLGVHSQLQALVFDLRYGVVEIR
jgi:DNA-binding NarL/FixJ family response regulator